MITGNLLVVTNKPLVELNNRLIHSNGHLCQIGSASHWLTGGLKTKMPIILNHFSKEYLSRHNPVSLKRRKCEKDIKPSLTCHSMSSKLISGSSSATERSTEPPSESLTHAFPLPSEIPLNAGTVFDTSSRPDFTALATDLEVQDQLYVRGCHPTMVAAILECQETH